MSDQIRSMMIVVLVALLLITGFVTFLNPTFVGAIAMTVISFMVGYHWGILDKFDL